MSALMWTEAVDAVWALKGKHYFSMQRKHFDLHDSLWLEEL